MNRRRGWDSCHGRVPAVRDISAIKEANVQFHNRNLKQWPVGFACCMALVLAIGVGGCAQPVGSSKKGKFDVIDNRPVPQSYVHKDESYTMMLKGNAGGIATLEVTGMANVLQDTGADRLKAEQAGAAFLAQRNQCGGKSPFPVYNSHLYNKKHEFWTIRYSCA